MPRSSHKQSPRCPAMQTIGPMECALAAVTRPVSTAPESTNGTIYRSVPRSFTLALAMNAASPSAIDTQSTSPAKSARRRPRRSGHPHQSAYVNNRGPKKQPSQTSPLRPLDAGRHVAAVERRQVDREGPGVRDDHADGLARR